MKDKKLREKLFGNTKEYFLGTGVDCIGWIKKDHRELVCRFEALLNYLNLKIEQEKIYKVEKNKCEDKGGDINAR